MRTGMNGWSTRTLIIRIFITDMGIRHRRASMHIIRHSETGLFFRKGAWTKLHDSADRFKDKAEVDAVVREHEIKHGEMLVVSGGRVVGGAPLED